MIDLMEALKASVEAAKAARKQAAEGRASRRRRRREGSRRGRQVANRSALGCPREHRPSAGVDPNDRRDAPGASGPQACCATGVPTRLELRLEQVLVDLALVDRDALLDAEPMITSRSIPSSFDSSSGVRWFGMSRLLLSIEKSPPAQGARSG